MRAIAVVIPIYKAEPSESELASIRQSQLKFTTRDIYLIYPEGMNTDKYEIIARNVQMISFDRLYFNGIAGYNKLMFSSKFYERFLSYKFILICQTDVWVFKDDLDFWISKDYNYVGAPWISLPPLSKKKSFIDLRRLLLNRVGNGGFSLRSVKVFYRICMLLPMLKIIFIKNEDLFWGYFAQKLGLIKAPTVERALTFAFELAPRRAFLMNKGRLPMACHAWEKYDKDFWLEHIKYD